MNVTKLLVQERVRFEATGNGQATMECRHKYKPDNTKDTHFPVLRSWRYRVPPRCTPRGSNTRKTNNKSYKQNEVKTQTQIVITPGAALHAPTASRHRRPRLGRRHCQEQHHQQQPV